MKLNEMNQYINDVGYTYLVFLAVVSYEKHPHFDEMLKCTTHPVVRVITSKRFDTPERFYTFVKTHLDALNCGNFKTLISGDSWKITGATPFRTKANLDEFLSDSYAYTVTMN
ncbi:hypothetical protein A7M79_01580 [Acinetobacter baumannii]|uniref:hypothetical protein n=1 Tax=Acinetobacter baumannii TaxID=470 RepID=UPI0008DC9CB6|nr:hypothetical protein [Acinetobacter baumannii]OIH12207.1 hypothetical protein A7M79_01580 [Acinetobacter baumannii]